MSLSIASLNSGSNGNCYYIGNKDEAVLIDVGIPASEVVKRMKRLGISIESVKAIFISHEHGDHVVGVPKLSKKFQVLVYITPSTLFSSGLSLDHNLVKTFTAYESISIGNLTIRGFPKYHDAVDPHSFLITNETVRVGVFTDIGFPCRHVIHHFRQCHAAFLECNYDIDMLIEGPYPLALKNRIRNGMGHLSNRQAIDLFIQHRPSFMSHLILSHLSRTNNRPSIVESLFSTHADNTEIAVASRSRETKLYTIEARPNETINATLYPVDYAKQLTLF